MGPGYGTVGGCVGQAVQTPLKFNVQYLLTIIFYSIIPSGVPVCFNERDVSHRLFRLGKQGTPN
jgi:hypothetical protein